jgi:hypothetical protein
VRIVRRGKRIIGVRDAYLWVTLDTGFETYWPVSELIAEQPDGLFTEYAR